MELRAIVFRNAQVYSNSNSRVRLIVEILLQRLASFHSSSNKPKKNPYNNISTRKIFRHSFRYSFHSWFCKIARLEINFLQFWKIGDRFQRMDLQASTSKELRVQLYRCVLHHWKYTLFFEFRNSFIKDFSINYVPYILFFL